MSRAQLFYRDIAPGAAEDALVTSLSAVSFSRLDRLPLGVENPPIASLEHGAWGLTGTYALVDSQTVAFWSAGLSGTDCRFAARPVITITFDRQHSSVGLTLCFDRATGDFCRWVNIQWYQGAVKKAEQTFSPDASTYFCNRRVESYNKLVLTFDQTKLPHHRLKLEQIIFGIYRYFDREELRRVSSINEMDDSALTLPVSQMCWDLDSRADVGFMFQFKQPVELRSGTSLLGVYYIDAFRRSAESLYSIDCYDALGVLEESPFLGGVYTNRSAKSLITEIVGGYFDLLFEAADINLTGALLPSSRRSAMQQVLFAWGQCASTDGGSAIRIFSLPAAAKEIGRDRTFSGVSAETASLVTRVEVTAHAYTQAADGDVEIGGVKYRDSRTVYSVSNPNVTASDKQNVVEVTGATLVSPTIGQATAQRVYDHYAKRNKNRSRFVWDGERLGDCVTQPNAWGGNSTGNLVRMEIALSNTVVIASDAIGE